MVLSMVSIVASAENAEITLNNGIFVENFGDFSNAYSITNLRYVTDNALLTNELYNDDTLWQLGNGKNAAEVVYKLPANTRLNSVYFEFSRDKSMMYPIIAWSEDGVSYTDLTTRMDIQRGEDEVVLADWTRMWLANEENGWQTVYSTEKAVPASARYIKFEVQAGSLSSDRTFFRKAVFSGEERAVSGSRFADDFANFDNVYSSENISQVKNNSLLTNAIYNDDDLWTVTNTSEKAEVVYKAKDGMFFSNVEFEFSRMVNIKYPVLSYSSDGVNYTDLTSRMSTAAGDSATVAADWTKLAVASKENGAQNVYSTSKQLPEGAKYIKVEIQAGSSARPLYLRGIVFGLAVFNKLTSTLTEDFDEFKNVYKSNNLSRVTGAPILENAAYGDNTLWTVEDVSKASEVVYTVNDDGELKKVYFEFSRNRSMIYPVLSYSYDGVTYYDLTTRMMEIKDEDDVVKQDWTRKFLGNDGNLWQTCYSTTKELPKGTKFFKVETVENASSGPFYFRKAKLFVESGEEISESVTDEFDDTSKGSFASNFMPKTAEVLGDTSVFGIDDISETAEIEYKVEPGKQFSRFELEIAKRDKIKFPVVTYSMDGKSYTNVNIPMAVADYEENYDWGYAGALVSGYEKFVFEMDLPENVRFLKVWTQKNSVSSQDDLLLSKIELSVENYSGIAQQLSDFCEDFGDIYSSTNINVAEPSMILARGLDDSSVFAVTQLGKGAEVVYKAADSKEFSEITVEYVRQNQIEFPVVAYSKDNVTYTNVSPIMDGKAYTCEGWKNCGTVYKPDGTSSYYSRWSLTRQMPTDVKYIKIWLDTDAVSRLTDMYINRVDLSVRNDNSYERSMFEEYSEYFDICMAVEGRYLDRWGALVSSQANVMVTENGAKSWIHYGEGEDDWDWSTIDAVLSFAEEHNMKVRAHTLVCPDFFDAYSSNGNTTNSWFFEDENGNSLFDANGNPVPGARELTLKRLEKHIKTIMTKYKGRIYAYDVLNEPYCERGAWRTYTRFWRLLGTDDDSWINDCFRWAHEADPDAVLILNDNAFTWDEDKENVLYNKIKEMRDQGIPADIGGQMHYGVDTSLADIEAVLQRFSGLCDFYITELDLKMRTYNTLVGTTYSDGNGLQATISAYNYPDYMRDEVAAIQGIKYASLFDLFRKYSDTIPCVGVWGVCESMNDYTYGRAPLMFDAEGNEKAGYFGAMDFEGKLPRWQPEDRRPKYRRINYKVDEADGTVRIIVDAEGVEKEFTATLYNTTSSGTEKLYGEPALQIGQQSTVTDNECSFTFPLSGYNPDDTVDTSRYIIKLNAGDEEILDYFYYIPTSAYNDGMTIVEDFNDFEKAYDLNHQIDVGSNLSKYDNDFAGFVTTYPSHTVDKFIDYKVPEGHQLDNVTLDAYVYRTYKDKYRPVVSVSANGVDYTRVSYLSDWPASSEITDKVYPGQYGSGNRHHFRLNLSDIPAGMKYMRIDLNEFTGEDQVYLSKLRIETALSGEERVYSLTVDSKGKTSVFGINGAADKGLNLVVAGYDKKGRALNCKMFEVDLDSVGTVVEKQLEAPGAEYFRAFLMNDGFVPIIDFAESAK